MIHNPADGSVAERVSTGSARRRRERRLRSMLRHERMSVAMALAERLHHSANVTGLRKKEEVEQVWYNALRGQKTARAGGGLPAPLSEVAGRQVVLVRHSGKQLIDDLPSVQILDAPMPQMAGTVLDFCRTLDLPVDEQVITVPKFSTDRVPQRLVERCFPQLAEQLVEVPTVLSYSLLQQRTAEQTIGFPVPGRGEVLVEVFKASPRDRAQQRFVVLKTSIFLFLTVVEEVLVEEVLVEVFKGFPKDRVPQRLPVSRPLLSIVEVFKVFLPDMSPDSVLRSRTSTSQLPVSVPVAHGVLRSRTSTFLFVAHALMVVFKVFLQDRVPHSVL